MEGYIWRGSSVSLADSGVIEGRRVIKNLTITNRTQQPVTMNIIVKTVSEGSLYIAPMNLKLQAGTSYRDWNINLNDRDSVQIQSSGQIDFYCSFGNFDEEINR